MSLGSALQIAQNSLLNVTRQTSVVSRNVTDAGNENYTRRQGVISSSNLGSRVVVVRSGVDAQLAQASLQALSDTEAQKIVSNRLDQLNITINGADGSRAPAKLLTALHDGLQTLGANPSNTLLASAAVQDAKDLANALNSASGAIQIFKSSMDTEISQEVQNLNRLLSDFEQANTEVVNGTRSGREVNDALDRRDEVLKEITKIVPVNVMSRSGNDMALITKGGATLFETIPRNVTFDATAIYSPTTPGNPIRVDGVPVLGGQGANTNAGGTLSAMVQLRDTTGTSMQGQLDEIARGIITAFAETDATAGALPSLTGLFSYSGSPALPPAGTLISGLSSQITINPLFDESQGGSAALLRDGGANGAGYLKNTTNGASFSDHLISLVQSLDATTAFDGQTGVGGTMSVMVLAAQSGGWLDGQRADASQAAESKQALFVRLSEKMSNQTGVNIDEEMAQLLQLEHSYEASARMISTVDEMLSTLMQIVR